MTVSQIVQGNVPPTRTWRLTSNCLFTEAAISNTNLDQLQEGVSLSLHSRVQRQRGGGGRRFVYLCLKIVSGIKWRSPGQYWQIIEIKWKNESTHLDILCLAFSMDAYIWFTCLSGCEIQEFQRNNYTWLLKGNMYGVAHRILGSSYSQYTYI